MTRSDVLSLLILAGVILACLLARRHNRQKNASALSAAFASGHAEGHAAALASVQSVQSTNVAVGADALGAEGLRIIRESIRAELASGVGHSRPPTPDVPPALVAGYDDDFADRVARAMLRYDFDGGRPWRTPVEDLERAALPESSGARDGFGVVRP